MIKENVIIPLEKLQLNTGQLSWLGENPRTFSQVDIDRTVQSLREDPDMVQERPVLVVPAAQKGEFVVFAGNLRTTAAGILGWTEIHCTVHVPENKTDRETICRRALKDNGSFGTWRADTLSSGKWAKYGKEQLRGFGIPGVVMGDVPAVAPAPASPAGFTVPQDALPEELRGQELDPAQLEKLQGADQVAFERVIICYKAEEADKLAKFLGMEAAPDKVVYKYVNGVLE